MKDKKLIWSSQHGLTKVKSRLNNLSALYNEVTGFVDDGKAVDVVYLNYSKVSDTVSHKIVIGKLMKYTLR